MAEGIARRRRPAGWLVTVTTARNTVFARTGQGTCPITDGQGCIIAGYKVEVLPENRPGRFTEGELVSLMRWPQAAMTGIAGRLDFALGTPGGRGDLIENLKAQGLVAVDRDRLRPTHYGRSVHALISSIAPEIFDVGLVADLDARLHAFKDGHLSEEDLLRSFLAQVTALVSRFASRQSSCTTDRRELHMT